MSARIHRHAMSIRSKHTFANSLQTAVAFVEDGDNAAFG